MKPLRRPAAPVAGLALCLALMTACGADGNEPENLPSDRPTSGEAPTTSPEPTESTSKPATSKDEAAAGAEQTLRDYVAFTDALIADPEIDLQRLRSYLQDPELTDRRSYFQQFRDQGFYSEGGSTTFEWVKATKVRLYPEKNEAAVSLRACRNFGTVEVHFESGKPVQTLSPSLGTYEVYNYDWPNPTGWRIAVEDEPGERCEP